MTEQLPLEPNGHMPELNTPEGHAMAGVTKMITPSIMQCGQGGYIVMIPGVGLMAASSMEEIMTFVSQNADRHFRAQSEFPAIIQRGIEKAVDKVRQTDSVMALIIVGLGAIIAAYYLNIRRERAEASASTTVVRQVPTIPYEAPK